MATQPRDRMKAKHNFNTAKRAAPNYFGNEERNLREWTNHYSKIRG